MFRIAPTIKYLIAQRDMEVWLAPIADTRVLVPYRISIPTPIGIGVLQATQFVSTSQPRAAAVGSKTQYARRASLSGAGACTRRIPVVHDRPQFAVGLPR